MKTTKLEGTLQLIDTLESDYQKLALNPMQITNNILIDIAVSMAIIADAYMPVRTMNVMNGGNKDGDDKSNENIPNESVSGSNMVARESTEDANKTSSSNIQKDDGSEETEKD